MTAVFVLTATSVFSALFPVGVGIGTIRRLKLEMRFLVGLFIFAALVEGITFYQALSSGGSHLAHYIYAPVEYALLIYVFSFWQENGIVRRAIRISIPIYILICLADMNMEKGLNSLNVLTRSLANIIYVLVASYTMLMLLRKDSGSIYRDFRFWIASGVLLYSSGSLAYFTLHNLMPSDILLVVWYIHNGLNITANLMYAAAFLCQYRQ